MPYALVDLSRVRIYPLVKRENLVALQNLVTPEMPAPKFEQAELPEVVERQAAARRQGRPVIWMMGGHVIKRGLRVRLLGEFTADRQAEIDPAMVQAQELYTKARAGDSLLVMAGRDAGQGALQAAIAASALGLTVIALAGCGDTELNRLADVSIEVPGETENTARTALAGLIQILADILAGD